MGIWYDQDTTTIATILSLLSTGKTEWWFLQKLQAVAGFQCVYFLSFKFLMSGPDLTKLSK